MSPMRHVAVLLLAFALAAPAAAQQKDEVVKNPAADSAEAAIAQALKAGLAGDFDAYLEAIHSEHKETKDQRGQRERYEWKRFSAQVRWYVVAEDPITFVVARRVTESDKFMKVFLKDQKNKDRMPVPVSLKKDGAAWKIVTSSL